MKNGVFDGCNEGGPTIVTILTRVGVEEVVAVGRTVSVPVKVELRVLVCVGMTVNVAVCE
jgi:hypothetical protein